MTFVVPEERRSVRPGDRIDKLTVLGVPFYARISTKPKASRAQHAVVQCDCGTVKIAAVPEIKRWPSASCGCAAIKHGLTGSRLFSIWVGMTARCNYKSQPGYPMYGGRGIAVCDEWSEPKSFITWAKSNGYSDSLQLDRINSDGNYEPGNCRWVTPTVNVRNRRTTKKMTAFGETKPVAEWAEDPRSVLGYVGLNSRLNKGMSPEEALITPSRYRKPK